MNIQEKFINALKNMDRDASLSIILDALDQNKISVDETLELLSISLSLTVNCDIDEIWKEHLKTQIVRTVLENVSRYTINEKPNTNGKKIAIVCPDGEYHELGARIVSEIIRREGYVPLFFGNSIPNDDVSNFVKSNDLAAISFSVSNFYSLHKLNPLIKEINILKKDLPILIGGLAVKHNSNQIYGNNVMTFITMEDFKQSLRNLI